MTKRKYKYKAKPSISLKPEVFARIKKAAEQHFMTLGEFVDFITADIGDGS